MEGDAKDPPSGEGTQLTEKQVYGDYQIVRPIGKGKFAIVYRAQRISDGEIVALKRISVDTIDSKARDKCLKEVGLLQSLDHPNVIKYLDSFISDDDLVIVVEWAAAGDLKRQLRKAQEKATPFEERIIWKYFSQIADAIHHMHEKRIMHRDLKPANIFLTLDGTIKVGDLGLSRELSEHTVQAHSKVGTPLYMSPEVLRGDGYDFKSDIWSLGCLLYELAMLKSPFKADGLNLYSLFQKISQADYTPITADYSEELRSLVSAMMSTNPQERPELSQICESASKMRVKYAEMHQKLKRANSRASSSNTNVNLATTTGLDEPQETGQKAPALESTYPLVKDKSSEDKPSSSPIEKSNQGPSDRGELYGDTREIGDAGRVGARPSVADEYIYQDNPPPVKSTNDNTKFQRFGPKSFGLSNDSVQSDKKSNSGFEYPSSLQSAAVPAPKKQPSSIESVQRRLKSSDKDRGGGDTKQMISSINPKSAKPQRQVMNRYESEEQLSMNDESMGDQARRPASSEKNSARQNSVMTMLKDSSPVYSSMSAFYDKAVVLGLGLGSAEGGPGRDSEDPYTMLPFQFAVDLTQIGLANRRHLLPPGSPFLYFVSTVSWLFRKIEGSEGPSKGYRAPVFRADDDPPLAVAKHILLESQAAGVPAAALSEIPATSLLPGYGLKVCALLNLIADKAVSAVGHRWRPFVYADGSASGENDLEIEHPQDDEIAEDLSDTDNARELEKELNVSYNGGDGRNDGLLGRSMILPNPSVRPEDWSAETERVASKLAAMRLADRGGRGWADTLVLLRAYGQLGKNKDDLYGVDSIAESLRSINVQLSESMSNIKRLETMMNSKQSNSAISIEYRKYQEAKLDLESQHRASSEKAVQLTSALADLTEALDELSDRVSARAGSGPEGADGSVVKLKEAIKTIKAQISELNTSTGLSSVELLRCQQLTAEKIRVDNLRKHKSRMLHGGKALSSSFGGGELDSDGTI